MGSGLRWWTSATSPTRPAPNSCAANELGGPDTLTGADLAAVWTAVLGRDVRYGGDDLGAFEQQAAGMMPGWMARDMRMMLRAFHRYGMIPGNDSRATLEALIGHPLRSYRAFAEEVVKGW